jgi:hypothetical protein
MLGQAHKVSQSESVPPPQIRQKYIRVRKKKVRKIRTTDAITVKEISCAMVKEKVLCLLSVARKLP